GRSPSADLTINDSSVSRRHAQISVGSAGCLLKDLGSLNGTYVNGEQIVEETAVADGDRILLGQVQLRVGIASSDAIVVTEDDTGENVGAVIRRSGGPEAHEMTVAVDAPRLLKLLSEISRTLVGTRPIDEVLGHVVELAFDATRAT